MYKYKSLQNDKKWECREQLVEGVLHHGGGGEDGDDGHQVGEEPEHPETGEQYALTPKLTLLPGLRKIDI